MRTIGIQAIISIIVQIGFIVLAFRAIQSIHIERFLHQDSIGLRLLIVLLSIAIGASCATFFMNFFDLIRNLMFLF